MRPSLDDLHTTTLYKNIAAFPIDDTMKFLMGNLDYNQAIDEQKTSIKRQKYLKLVLPVIVGIIIGIFGVDLLKNVESWQIGLGFLLLFILILPVHEWIHGLTFKSFDATDVGYGISWKAGMVYAYAQKFPIDMRELIKVAIMPFSIITPTLILCMVFFPGYRFTCGFMLLLHTLACIGDFALVWYALKNKDKVIYTYDDVREEKRTYFFEKI